MSPPLSKEDLDAIGRMVDSRIAASKAPSSRRHLDVQEVIPPAVARKISESHHEIDDRSMGFERIVKDAIERIENKVDKAVKSIPPAADAAKGAELAAVAGAQASIRSEGKQAASLIATNRAETHARKSESWTKWSSLIQFIINAIVVSVLGYYATHPTPPEPAPEPPPRHQAP